MAAGSNDRGSDIALRASASAARRVLLACSATHLVTDGLITGFYPHRGGLPGGTDAVGIALAFAAMAAMLLMTIPLAVVLRASSR